MITSSPSHLSLNTLQNGSPRPLADALEAAQKLISPRTGIITKVEFDHLTAGEPRVYFARSTPANSVALTGMETLSFGDATSTDPERAIMKAVGETIERYCPSHFSYEDFHLAAYNDLAEDAVHPADFALFSDKQYAEPGFHFTRMTDTTPLRWVSAYSIIQDKPVWVPASFVYIPYFFNTLHEPITHTPISTGLACGPNLAHAVYKGILEVIERDAFMIMWQNQLPCREVDLSTVDNPYVQAILDELTVLPVQCQAYLIPTDFEVPVILILLKSTSGKTPHTVMGISVDLDPQKALLLALEEASLSWVGMGRYAQTEKDYKPAKDYQDIKTLTLHGLAHAVDPNLGQSIRFLDSPEQRIAIQDIKNSYDENMVNNVRHLAGKFEAKKMNILVNDLTTADVDEIGFKVVRAIVPGMQPLDVNHARRYLGGTRLYDVPCQLGLRSRPLNETELNPFPHMFP